MEFKYTLPEKWISLTKALRMNSTTEKSFCRIWRTAPAGQASKKTLFWRFCSFLVLSFLPRAQICWVSRSLRCWLESYRILFFLLCFDLVWFTYSAAFQLGLSNLFDICLTLFQTSLLRVLSLLFTSQQQFGSYAEKASSFLGPCLQSSCPP